MKRAILAVALAAGLIGLGACSSLKGEDVQLDMQAIGGNANVHTGVSLGDITANLHTLPVVAPDGKTPIVVPGVCPGSSESIATYDIMAGNATANVTVPATNTATAAGGAGASQNIAVAANRMSSTGRSAIILASGGGGAPTPASIDATAHCPGINGLPAAPAGSIVLQGAAPK